MPIIHQTTDSNCELIDVNFVKWIWFQLLSVQLYVNPIIWKRKKVVKVTHSKNIKMKSNNHRLTTLLITLNLLTVLLAENNHTETPSSHDIQSQINDITTDDSAGTTTTTTSEETFPESSTVNEITTTTAPETDSSSSNGFQIILYIFATIGLTFSMICLIQIVRSSSYCDRENKHSMSNRERSRSWRCSWRGNNTSRQYVGSDHIIAVWGIDYWICSFIKPEIAWDKIAFSFPTTRCLEGGVKTSVAKMYSEPKRSRQNNTEVVLYDRRRSGLLTDLKCTIFVFIICLLKFVISIYNFSIPMNEWMNE